jgi:hypothetical protein
MGTYYQPRNVATGSKTITFAGLFYDSEKRISKCHQPSQEMLAAQEEAQKWHQMQAMRAHMMWKWQQMMQMQRAQQIQQMQQMQQMRMMQQAAAAEQQHRMEWAQHHQQEQQQQQGPEFWPRPEWAGQVGAQVQYDIH